MTATRHEATPETGAWTLWVVAAACALHATEELLTGWQAWARDALGIDAPTPLFVVANAVLVAAAVVLAGGGWRRPTAALVIPAATLVNALGFHILPTLVQRRVAPGVYTAVLLYLPFSSWAFVAAWRAGVPRRALAAAALGGALLMTAVLLGARALGGRP